MRNFSNDYNFWGNLNFWGKLQRELGKPFSNEMREMVEGRDNLSMESIKSISANASAHAVVQAESLMQQNVLYAALVIAFVLVMGGVIYKAYTNHERSRNNFSAINEEFVFDSDDEPAYRSTIV